MSLRAVVMARATVGEADGGTSITLGRFEREASGACGVDKSPVGRYRAQKCVQNRHARPARAENK